MRLSPIRLLVLVVCVAVAWPAQSQQQAFEPFVVRDFRVEGDPIIEDGTIYTYLPINIGDTLDAQLIREAIRALYATEFFQDIELRRDGDTLVIAVLERPRIESFTFEGNRDIKDDQLEDVLEQTGMQVGKIFDRSLLEEITRSLTDEYYAQGKYGATVNPTVEDVPGNRVRVHIEIEEGQRSKLREINIVGNTAFDQEELLGNFELQTGGLFSRFSKNDRYSKTALEGDLEALRSYYMDRGYADFRIADVQVSISPDKSDIFISIAIDEGDIYTVSSVELAGETILPREALLASLYVQPGQGFSQQLVTLSEELIEQVLSQQGYAFADVQPLPDLDDETKEVDLTFFVDPQSRVYVRRIDFTGAEGSNDEVFRRELRQLEGGVLQSALLDRSEERIRLLPYVDDVAYETNQVLGTSDLVDVTFDVTEGLPGSMGGSIGYSDAQGVILGGDFVHSNFLGTGNRVQLNLNGGKYFTVYGFSFTEPYVNMNGLSRQVSLQYQDITQFSSVTSDFSTETLTAGMSWGLPLSENQRLSLGFSYNDSELLMSAFSSQQARQWVQNNGETFQITPNGSLFGTRVKTFDLLLGWEYEGRNRSLFPDQGMRFSFNMQASIPGSEVEYYLAYLNVEKYFPLFGQWRFRINSELSMGDAYGDSTALPPYKNFFAGGPNSIRGYKENYLGPRDSFGNPNGGNMLVVNQLEIMLPTPEKFGANARMAFFYDIGNVFHTGGVDFYDRLGDRLDTDFSSDKLKRSYGIGVQWLSPMGLLQFSYAIPLNKDRETDRFFSDQTENFQFTIRQGF